MIEIRLIEIAGLLPALMALHLPFGKPMKSTIGDLGVEMSEEDIELLKRLIKAGDEHAKAVRGIVAYLEINAPRFWWQEFDTYRIGCEKLSSESTMHIQGKGLSEAKLVKMKSELTEGTMQKRIVMVSYQTLRRMYKQRRNHRLPHWRGFCELLTTLPHEWLITYGI